MSSSQAAEELKETIRTVRARERIQICRSRLACNINASERGGGEGGREDT